MGVYFKKIVRLGYAMPHCCRVVSSHRSSTTAYGPLSDSRGGRPCLDFAKLRKKKQHQTNIQFANLCAKWPEIELELAKKRDR